MAIVLQAKFDPECYLFDLSIQVDNGPVCEQSMFVESFRQFCQRADDEIRIGDCHLVMVNLSKRTRRGIVQYFRSVLCSYVAGYL